MQRLIFLIFLVTCFTCCKSKIKNQIAIDFNRATAINEQNLFNYYSIPLETNNDSRLVNPAKMIITDSCFFIFDQSQEQIFLFKNKTGQFVKKLLPADSLKAIDFCFNEQERIITVLLSKDKHISLKNFDETGLFLKDLKVSDSALKYIGPAINRFNRYLCFDRGSLFIDGKHLSFLDSNATIHEKSIIDMSGALKGAGWIVSNTLTNVYNDSLFSFPLLSDTIYSIDKNLHPSPSYILNIKNKERIIPESFLSEYVVDFSSQPTLTTSMDKKGYIWEHSCLLQNNEFLYFSVRDGAILCGAFFNKKSGQSYLVNGSTLDSTSRFKFALPMTTYKGQFASMAYSLKVPHTQQLSKMENNPTVIIYNLKFKTN